MNKRIAIIDDEVSLRQSLQIGFTDCGYQVDVAENLKAGFEMVRRFRPHLLFLDIRLPDGNGIDFIEKLKEEHPLLQIIMMTAYGNTSAVVKAIKNGAIDYVNKPFEWEEIEILAQKAFEAIRLQHEVKRYKWENKHKHEETFIGRSKVMQKLVKELALAAPTEATILIKGETGTGKECIARMIHEESLRADKPFIAINCGSIPAHLIESELFGYEKGAFTGANQMKQGLIEWADEGTLFLDEIGELPLDVQVKFLRFLEERTVKRVGGHQDIEVNIRVISATNRSLEKMVEAGKFRSDLFYRLHVVPITVPPLREREEDILELCQYYLHYYSSRLGKKVPTLSKEDQVAIYQYSWPGNVRELRNIIERYVILFQTGIQLYTLLQDSHHRQPSSLQGEEQHSFEVYQGFSLEEELEKIERGYIEQALKQTKYHVSKSAELLGVSRYALQRRIEKYNLK